MSTLAHLAPAIGGFEISPHDTNALSKVTRAIYVGGAGHLTVTMHDGTVVTFPSVLAGSLLPIRVRLVMATNTTATNIVGLY